MEKYSKAVSAMYSQFKQREAHPMEKYIGRHAALPGHVGEVVGYVTGSDGSRGLVICASGDDGWTVLDDGDVIIKKCKSYWYASIQNLVD